MTCAYLDSDSLAMGKLSDEQGYLPSEYRTRTIIGNLTKSLDEIKISRKPFSQANKKQEATLLLTERNQLTELRPRGKKTKGKISPH